MPYLFSHASVAAAPQIEVIEVGTRDGLQIEKTIVSPADKIALINQMLDAGLRSIEVTSFVSPKAVPQLADAFDVLHGIRKRSDTCLTALVPNKRGAERACDTPLDGGVLLVSASNTHNLKNLNRTVDDSMAGFDTVAQTLRDGGIQLFGAIATTFGCPFEGEVPIADVVRIARHYGDLGVRAIALSDTTGMATPRNIRAVVRAVREAVPTVELGLHLHNTRGIGLANVLAGLDEGIRRFDSSVGGLGGCPFAAGATGNICTEDLLYLLAECGYETGVNLQAAIGVAQRMEALLNKPLSGQVMRAGPRLALHSTDAVATAAG